MTLAQGLFILALTVVLATVVWFAVLVVGAARRSDGGSHVTWKLMRRLQRSPTERTEFNRWAFYAHRVTGFAIFGFLCLHIVDVSTYSVSPSLYDELHELYGTVPMRVFESGLLFAILFHTFNGLRLLAVDFRDLGLQASKATLGVVIALTVVLGVAGTAVIMAPVFG
jgi:succinate dehydrogenase / fumarate reductase cytochrome b subunit